VTLGDHVCVCQGVRVLALAIIATTSIVCVCVCVCARARARERERERERPMAPAAEEEGHHALPPRHRHICIKTLYMYALACIYLDAERSGVVLP
jgi:hypothetical protein